MNVKPVFGLIPQQKKATNPYKVELSGELNTLGLATVNQAPRVINGTVNGPNGLHYELEVLKAPDRAGAKPSRIPLDIVLTNSSPDTSGVLFAEVSKTRTGRGRFSLKLPSIKLPSSRLPEQLRLAVSDALTAVFAKQPLGKAVERRKKALFSDSSPILVQ